MLPTAVRECASFSVIAAAEKLRLFVTFPDRCYELPIAFSTTLRTFAGISDGE